MFQRIIGSIPTLPDHSLTIIQRDLEIGDTKLSRSPPIPALQLSTAIAPTLTLELDETQTLVVPDTALTDAETASAIIAREVRPHKCLTAFVEGSTAHIEASVTIPALPVETEIEVYIHWGSYNAVASSWRDELVVKVSSIPTEATEIALQYALRTPTRGHYGATLFVQVSGTSERIWLGRLRQDDIHFWIDRDDAARVQQLSEQLKQKHADALAQLSESITKGANLLETVRAIRARSPFLGIGALLRELSQDPDHSGRIRENAGLKEELLNFGLGEVVFATPEGPHAAAGGLAQVISGLPPELARAGVPVTIITPLYFYQNGSKHQAAQTLLEKGFTFDGRTEIPEYVGTVDVHLGPTYYPGTTDHRRPATTVPVAVYAATFGAVRFFLLANSSAFDRLYQPVFVDEQLRRAIVLSRATLEVIATRHLGIRPSAIISNDWMTACIPAFAALEDRYRTVPWLKECKTIHMIHNGGADYHGRLPTHGNYEDLWPITNLAPEHFFGFRDPHRSDFINLTMAASHHASGGVLTVSEPYAKQLVCRGGGDGLEYVLESKRDSVFGISNGINRTEITRYLAHITNTPEPSLTTTHGALAAKAVAKQAVQECYGLTVNSAACLISFVGRMVEQKGLSLLSGFVADRSHSALEELLERHPNVQLLFAGPLTSGDRCASNLANALEYLGHKYPGRIASRLDYITHPEALKAIFASTFFLMPSRFEPGGITQLEALAAGTLVIGRNVGGISATIENFDSLTGTGTGFLCNDYCPTAFANTASWAIQSIQDEQTYRNLVTNALSTKHSWRDRVATYQALLQQIVLK
jgi:starch synthase